MSQNTRYSNIQNYHSDEEDLSIASDSNERNNVSNKYSAKSRDSYFKGTKTLIRVLNKL